MVVLSLFDGISCLKVAADKNNMKIKNYYASEIEKNPIKVSQDNHKNLIQIGDVCKVSYKDGILYTEKGKFEIGKVDLLAGGSPCQDFSIAKVNGLGLEGDKSKLFYEYLRIMKEVNPKYFLLENVEMKKEYEEKLNDYLGVEGLHIDSKLVSFQNRKRIYWTNIPGVTIPEDKNIDFQKYKELGDLKEYKLNPTPSRIRMWSNGNGKGGNGSCKNITNSNKINCVTRKQDRCPNSGLIEYEDFCRYLTRSELEQSQNLPIGYTKSVSYGIAQSVLGNCWTVDVIAHILSFIK